MRRKHRHLSIAVLAVYLAGTAAARAGIDRWSETGHVQGEIIALAIDPHPPAAFYAAASGGLFRSDDRGVSWTPIDTGLAGTPVTSLALAGSALYAASADGVSVSVDRGTTWTHLHRGLPDDGVQALAVDPATSDVVYAGTRSGVFKTLRAGWSWQSAGLAGDSIDAVAVDPATPSIVYAAAGGSLFRSAWGGARWRPAGTIPGTVSDVVIDPEIPAAVYAVSSAGLFRSADRGGTWTQILDDPTVESLAIDPVAPANLYAATAAGVLRSIDRGLGWEPLDKGLDDRLVGALAIDPASPSTVYAGTYGGGIFDIQLVDGRQVLVLGHGRFRARVQWDGPSPLAGPGIVAVLTARQADSPALRSRQSTVVEFFDGGNWELLLNVLDGRPLNKHFWVFLAGATNVGYTATVTDTVCGGVRTYSNPLGHPAAPVADLEGFADCGSPAPPSCLESPSVRCLGAGGRFRVEVLWEDFAGRTGHGRQAALPAAGLAVSDLSGLFTLVDPGRWELLVKVIDGCAVNGHFWVLAATASHAGYELTITDTATGATRTYNNATQAVSDTEAFAACGPGDDGPRPWARPVAGALPRPVVLGAGPFKPASKKILDVKNRR